MEKLFVIGCGPGSGKLLNGEAREKLGAAARVLSAGRARAEALGEGVKSVSLSELAAELNAPAAGGTAVLVSGDCGFFSAAKTIARDFSGLYDIELIPGVGSVQYLSAKLKVPYDDAALISLHGRAGHIVPKAAYNKKIFALTGGGNRVGDICRELCRWGMPGVRVSVGERLSYSDERIVTAAARELAGADFDELSVMCIENPAAADPRLPLRDEDFIRGAAPMTKEEVRWLSVRKLAPLPSDIIYDVGAGTGSVAVELARCASDGLVYAVEKDGEACGLIEQNIKRHGAFNAAAIRGEAPEAFSALPAPDKAFIGGSSGGMDAIVGALTAKNPLIKIVANAITPQSLGQILESFGWHGVKNTDLICVNIAKSKKVNGYDLMTAQNPVYIVTGMGGAGA